MRVCGLPQPPTDLSASAIRAALAPLFPPSEMPSEQLVNTVMQMLLAEALVTPRGRITEAGKRWLLQTFVGHDDGVSISGT